MHVRVRQRFVGSGVGKRKIIRISNGSVEQDSTSSFTSSAKEFGDVVGNRNGNNPAYSSEVSRSGGIASGTTLSSRSVTWTNWMIDTGKNTTWSHLAVANVPSDSWCATEVASQTNPSNATVNIPLSIAELRDIPKMVKRKFGQQKGNSVLESTFGWQPMVRDIQSIMRVIHSVESRIKTLNMMSSGAPLSRTRTAFSGVTTLKDEDRRTVDYTNRGQILSHRRLTTTRCDKRVTVQWKPNFDLSQMSDHEKWKYAMRIALGLEPTTLWQTAYELIPWSWLNDYFSNMGDLVSLTNNSVASMTGPPMVSTVRETKVQIDDYEIDPPGPVSVSPYEYVRRDWERKLVPVSLEYRLPILTIDQTLTLVNLVNNYS
jgi:hypothetical protein